MLINMISRLVTLTALLCVAAGCGGGTNTGIPPYGASLAFEDKSKANMLADGRLRLDRVDLNDSTKVIQSRPAKTGITYAASPKYTYRFILAGQSRTDSFVVVGINKFRLVYADRKEVDWLEFYNRSWEAPTVEQVKFNGKVISRLEVDEPVSPSYLYLLK